MKISRKQLRKLILEAIKSPVRHPSEFDINPMQDKTEPKVYDNLITTTDIDKETTFDEVDPYEYSEDSEEYDMDFDDEGPVYYPTHDPKKRDASYSQKYHDQQFKNLTALKDNPETARFSQGVDDSVYDEEEDTEDVIPESFKFFRKRKR